MKSLMLLLFSCYIIPFSSAQVRMQWAKSEKYAFAKAQKRNSLVMVYYYDTRDADMTLKVEQEYFFFSEAGSWEPNSFADYLNKNLFALKRDLSIRSNMNKATSVQLDSYPAFIFYYPDGEEAYRIVGVNKSNHSMEAAIEELNDEFQEASLLTENKAHYRYLEARLSQDIEQVEENCKHIACAYPVIHRLFKMIPEGEELTYSLEQALKRHALDFDGPEVMYLLNHYKDLEMDQEDLVYSFYESLLFEIIEQYGSSVSEAQISKSLELFLKDERLNKFGSHKSELISLIKEEIEMMKEK